MSKKIGVLLGLGLVMVSLSACSSKPVDLSYDETYKVFTQSLQINDQDILSLLGSSHIQEDFDINLNGHEDSFDIKLGLKGDGVTETNNMNMDTNTEFDFQIQDISKQGTMNASANISIKKIQERMYLKVQDFLLDAGPGNAEGQLLSLMVKQFANIRVELDYQDLFNPQAIQTTQFFKYFKNTEIINSLIEQNNLFVNLGKTDYDNNIAYRITKNEESRNIIFQKLTALGIINNNIQSEDIQFEGLLVIESENIVSLVIQTLVIDGEQPYTLGGKITLLEGELEIVDPLLEKTTNIERKQRRETILLSFRTVDYKHSPIEFDIKISPEFEEGELVCDINGTLSTKLPQFTTEQPLEEIVFDVKGIYKATITGSIDIQAPNEYSVLSQMLADDYGISSMIMGTGNDSSYVDMTLTGAIN